MRDLRKLIASSSIEERAQGVISHNVEMNQTVYVCRVRVPEGTREYATVLAPDDVFARGLPGVAIVGTLLRPLAESEDASPDVFTPNPAFVRFMQDVLAKHTPLVDSFRAEARRQREGWVYVIDARTPDPDGTVPPEDVIGAVEVKGRSRRCRSSC